VPPVAFGPGSALIPVKMLVEKADAVVIARILDGTISGEAVTLTLDTQEVLKGDLRAGDLLSVAYRLRPDAAKYARDVEKDRGVFFLKSTDGAWFLMPVASGYVQSVREAYYVLPTNSTPKSLGKGVQPSIHERVVAELAGAADSVGGHPGGGAVDFVSEYRLDTSPAMRSLFAGFKTSKDARLRAAALCVSIAGGDDQAFTQLEQAPEKLDGMDLSFVVEEIRFYFKAADARSVAHLGRLAVSQNTPTQLREASLTALARIHTRESLPYLAQFLDDSDANLQSLVVGGMAMFANNVPVGEHGPSAGEWKYRTEDTLRYSAMDPRILQNDPRILAFWKSWWAEHRAELE